MDEKEMICQIRLFTSGLCEVEFSVEIGCREVAVTKCPAPYRIDNCCQTHRAPGGKTLGGTNATAIDHVLLPPNTHP